MTENVKGIIYAFLAALFYAINVPCSKLLLEHVSSTFMAGILYLGAGIGVGVLYLFAYRKEDKSLHLSREDMPYVIGMVLLDILAPTLLMLGIQLGTSSNASLLGNFEIVATTMIASLLFQEKVSRRLWLAILLIVASSILLSLESGLLEFSFGSLLVLGATCCWGLENNCTRSISEKSTYQIVTIKGFFSGGGAALLAFLLSEKIPETKYVLLTLNLGFVAYGLSIFTYIRAQRFLGAAKTSAYYSIAPFIGVFLSFVLLKEEFTLRYFVALVIMIAATLIIIYDTLEQKHVHEHTHVLTHTHDGSTHTHVITHTHEHSHLILDEKHTHTHTREELEACLKDHPAATPH